VLQTDTDMVTTFLYRLIIQQNDRFIRLLVLQHEMHKLAHADSLHAVKDCAGKESVRPANQPK